MRGGRVLRALTPWALVAGGAGVLALVLRRFLDAARAGEAIEWRTPRALALLAGAALVGVIAFHLQRRRAATMGFSRTALVTRRGVGAWLADAPGALRTLAVAALAIALVHPETFRTIRHEEDSVDIMIVFDMSKSMEETDLPRDRLDAAQRVVRRFLRRTRADRVGLVLFGHDAMLQCPLTQDMKLLEKIVRDLEIGDVPALGTAIGDGLGLALAQLRRADGTCDPAPGAPPACPAGFTCAPEGHCQGPRKNKVVILLSDGDWNAATAFNPEQAARAAAAMGVKVYTILVGREELDFFGGSTVNPETLRAVATLTGGEFFRATDYATFDRGFQQVRAQLDKARRIREERRPDRQLFVPFVVAAIGLLVLELLLSHGRLRRLP